MGRMSETKLVCDQQGSQVSKSTSLGTLLQNMGSQLCPYQAITAIIPTVTTFDATINGLNVHCGRVLLSYRLPSLGVVVGPTMTKRFAGLVGEHPSDSDPPPPPPHLPSSLPSGSCLPPDPTRWGDCVKINSDSRARDRPGLFISQIALLFIRKLHVGESLFFFKTWIRPEREAFFLM